MKINRCIPYLFLLAAVILIVVSYKDIIHTFYQQDEWLTLGYVKAGAGYAMVEDSTFFDLLGGKHRILSLPLQIFVYHNFGFNTYALGMIALVLHLIASFLLYRVVYTLTKKYVVALLSGLAFVVFSTCIQAISWYATTFQTIPSFIFISMSVEATLAYIHTRKKWYFWLSFISSAAAFLFKESGGIALLVNPLVYVLFSKPKPRLLHFIKKYGIFVVYMGYIVYSRYITALSAPQYQSSTFIGGALSGYTKILINAFLYPYISFSQIIVPQKHLYELAIAFQNMYYQCCITASNVSTMAQNITSDLLASFFSLPLVFIVAVAYIKSKSKTILQFLILFYLVSYFPFINIERGSTYLDSRYMYVSTAIGIALITYSLLEVLSSIRHTYTKMSAFGAVVGLVCFFMLMHIKIDRNTMRTLAFQSQERLWILRQIKQEVPILPVKPVFYIETNKGDATQSLPFQQGIGHTLMVWYADDPQVPKSLLASYFLWNIKDQGYKEGEQYGFGYYRNQKDLQEAIYTGRIQKGQIIALYYDVDNKKITNITDTVIGKLY